MPLIEQNREDYLRTIYRLNEKDRNSVRSVDIARYLNISKASVSEMLKKLKDQKHIAMEPYSSIALTKKGLMLAKKLTYKHQDRLLFACRFSGILLPHLQELLNDPVPLTCACALL